MPPRQQGTPLENRIGIVTGWRCWIMLGHEGLLRPIYKTGLIWKPRQPHEAMCPDQVHPVPAEGCKCGLWAVCHPMLLQEVLWKEHTGHVLVVGQVALWGNIIEHERGWRAQFAYPAHLYVFSDDELLAQGLRERYLVPVAWGPAADTLRMILPVAFQRQLAPRSSHEPIEMPSVPSALFGVMEMIRSQEAEQLADEREDLRLQREAFKAERARLQLELEKQAAALEQERAAARAILKARLEERGIIQAQVAARAAVSIGAVSRTLAGQSKNRRVIEAAEGMLRDIPADESALVIRNHRRLRAALAAWGVQQQDIAKAAGLSPATVCHVLSGKRRSTQIARVERFAKQLIRQAKANERRQLEGLGKDGA